MNALEALAAVPDPPSPVRFAGHAPPRPPPCEGPVPAAAPGGAARPDPLTDLLIRHFGLARFHPWQREAIDALLDDGGRVLVVAPTGGGKSLCYQLPALALPGAALVLSPLISLMEDQVRALAARGIPATFLASTLPREENGRRLAALRRGAYKIVYAAPERLAFDGFLDALDESKLSLVAIDEAHCIVQWGHDFRPDYLRIGAALARLKPPRVIACTATATPDARDEILVRLGFREDQAPIVILRGFARPNLHLAVEEVSGPRDAFTRAAQALATSLGSPRAPSGAGIVYAATRRAAERMAERLRTKGWNATAYHAGLDPDVRAGISAGFAERRLPIVVATNAFGMGIDRPDVRIVVHSQPPSSIEAYYQEVGRAGRDGAPSDGLLLIAGIDIALRRRLAELGSDGGPASPADAARAWGLFRELLRYVDAASCRHDFILRYFGDEAESLGGCGHCDVCRDLDERDVADPEALAADVDILRRALSGVARAKGGAGMQAVAAMLAGEHTERVDRLRLDQLSTFGVLAGKSAEEALRVLRVLLANGWIDLTATDFPVPLITSAGWQVMRGEKQVRIRLPRHLGRRREERRSRPSVAASPAMGRSASASASASASTRSSPGERPSKRMSVEEAVSMGMDRSLFEALRVHRAALARDKDVPAYVIAPDRTLMELALFRPRSFGELGVAHGMGPARLVSYGEGFLAVLLGHPG
jgi:ATP-dependent DNA helicase RecQ